MAAELRNVFESAKAEVFAPFSRLRCRFSEHSAE